MILHYNQAWKKNTHTAIHFGCTNQKLMSLTGIIHLFCLIYFKMGIVF